MIRLFFTISAFILCLLTAFTARAQREIIQKAIDKIASAKNISYIDSLNGTEFFGTKIHHKHVVNVYGQANNTFKAYKVETYQGTDKFEYLFDGQKQLDLTFRDSTYTLSDPEIRTWVSPLHEQLAYIKDILARPDCTVKQLADSIINETTCYHLLIASEKPQKKTYDKYHVFISKKNNLVLGVIADLKGELSKDNVIIGIATRYLTYIFSDFHISSSILKNPVTINVPSGFRPEKIIPMLAKGTPAPLWTLTTTDGKTLSLNELKGKVVLMEFTFNGCAACMIALPVLEKMHKKYDGTDVAIVSVNYLDAKEAIVNFIRENKVESPIYLGNRPLAKTYHVSAGPSFYLINKQGQIQWSNAGYFEDFDNIVVKKIEELR